MAVGFDWGGGGEEATSTTKALQSELSRWLRGNLRAVSERQVRGGAVLLWLLLVVACRKSVEVLTA